MSRLVQKPVSLFGLALIVVAAPIWWFFRPPPAAAQGQGQPAPVAMTSTAKQVALMHAGLDAKSLAYWNAQRRGWVMEAEPIRLRVGASSADIRLEKTIRVR
jgi:hypothetical protein